MTDSGSGQRNDPYGPSERPSQEGYSGAPSWESSLNSGSWENSRPDENPPSPFSREGSSAPDPTTPPAGQSAGSAGSAPDYPSYHVTGPTQGAGQGDWPGYPPSGQGQPQPQQPPNQPYPPYPPYEQQQAPPYQAYEQPAMPSYAMGSNPYESTPYQVNPYQGYGVPQNHPQAVTVLVLGIISLVLTLSCGIGGLLGIPAVVIGGKARKEIDADPQRYGGRPMVTAGWVLGIVSVALLAVLVVIVVIAAAAGGFEN